MRVLAGRRFGFAVVLLFSTAIIAGAFTGAFDHESAAALSNGLDYTILILLMMLFIEVDFGKLRHVRGAVKTISVTWLVNFVVIPLVGFAVASLFLSGSPLLFAGAIIYFVAPCTDWFLGFTRLARGNVAVGAALIPINMVSQLLLIPVYLWIFVRVQSNIDASTFGLTLVEWFAIPLAVGVVFRAVLKLIVTAAGFDRIMRAVSTVTPIIIAVLIFQVFAGNIDIILNHVGEFVVLLAAAFVFFVVTYALAELVSRVTKLSYEDHVLLTMTTAARNAPMMLALAAIMLPGEPLVLAAIVIGMVVEFPHLTALVALLRAKRRRLIADESMGIAQRRHRGGAVAEGVVSSGA